MLSRRSFLALGAASAAATILPVDAMLAARATPLPAETPLLSYSVGTPGEWDWQAFKATSPEAAMQQWLESNCLGVCENAETKAPVQGCECFACLKRVEITANRQPEWDGKDVSPGDDLWLASGLGCTCPRCDGETFLDSGREVDGEFLCDGCASQAQGDDDAEVAA